MNLHRNVLMQLFLVGSFICSSSVAYADGVSAMIDSTKPVSGVITGQGVDRYTFDVSEKDGFVVSLSAVGEPAAWFMPSLSLLDPDNEMVDGSGQSFFSRVRGDEPRAGTWAVEVSRGDGGEDGGAYELRLIQVSKAKGTPVKFGQAYEGDIIRGAVDIYTISGTPDVTASLSLTVKEGAGFMPEVNVYTPGGTNGGMMGCTDSCSMDLLMQENGPYTVMIWRNDANEDQKGSYTFSVQRQGDARAAQGAPELLSAEAVFANPITPIWEEKTAAPRRFGSIYIYDTFLTIGDNYPPEAEFKEGRKGNPFMQVYLGDHSYPDIKQAVNWWIKAADQGNADARNRLGMVNTSTVTDKKYETAAWYRLVVEQGPQDAEIKHANKYLTGRGASRDFTQALALYRKAAERGSRVAQFNLAVLYTLGLETPPDFAAAAKWYEKAAAQGLLVAQHNLGELYEWGQGVAQDYAKAAKLYSKAAESEYPPSFYRLGRLYLEGRGIPKDAAKALTWLKKAAAAGHVDAQGDLDFLEGRKTEAVKLWQQTASFGNTLSLHRLIELYRKEGIPRQDYDEVLEIYRWAANKNHPQAFAGLGDLFAGQSPPDYPEAYYWYSLASVPVQHLAPEEEKELVHYASGEARRIEKELSPEQVAVAKWRINDRKPQPLTEAQRAAAEIYARGAKAWWQEGDVASALVFYLQADRQNIARAQSGLAYAFENGIGVMRNMEKAAEYYRKAVRNGLVGPATSIGHLHYFGMGFPRDLKEAAKWYEMDASRGYRPAIQALGLLYLYETKDGAQKAIAMYEKAADRGVLEANDALGMIYLYGLGVAKDHAKALKWYLKAADQGSPTGEIQASVILAKHEPRDYGRALRLIGRSLDPVALNNRAYMYEHGLGVHEPEDTRGGQAQPTALELYRAAAELCYGRSMYHIGRLMEKGVEAPSVTVTPMKKNAALAREWMIRAAQYGSAAAAIWLESQTQETKSTAKIPPEEVIFPPPPCIQKE